MVAVLLKIIDFGNLRSVGCCQFPMKKPIVYTFHLELISTKSDVQ